MFPGSNNVMPYVTCTNSKDGEISVRLNSRIENVHEVGVVEFFYDASKLQHETLSKVEKQVTLEYMLNLDNTTVLSEFPNCTIYSLLYQYKPVFSTYFYSESSRIPRLEGTMTAINEDPNYPSPYYPERHFSFNSLFSSNLIARDDFKISIKYCDIAPPNEPLNRSAEANYANISIIPSTKNYCILKVDVIARIPFIHFTINRAAYLFFDIERLENIRNPGAYSAVVVDKHSDDKYHIKVNQSFQHTFNVPYQYAAIVRKLIKKYFNGCDTLNGYTIRSDILHAKTDVVEFVSEYNRFVHAFAVKHNIIVDKPILDIREGRLYPVVDAPLSWRILISNPLRLYLGLPTDVGNIIGIRNGHYGGMIMRAKIATIIKCPILVYNAMSQDSSDITVIPSVNDAWYCPKQVSYVPLSINTIDRFTLHITDYEGHPLFFDNLQFFIVLHFR